MNRKWDFFVRNASKRCNCQYEWVCYCTLTKKKSRKKGDAYECDKSENGEMKATTAGAEERKIFDKERA